MATTMTLADLKLAARQRADMVNSQFVSDPELVSYINQSYFELYDLLVQSYGDNYYISEPVLITTDGTTQRYPLPDGTLYSNAQALYKLLGVDFLLQAGNPSSAVTLKRFNFSQRNRRYFLGIPAFWGATVPRYEVLGTAIMFDILPSAGQTIQLWYIPRMTQLSQDSDVVDGVSGWTEYIIVDAAIKCMQKEESDVSVLMAQKAALIARIQAAAANRDSGMPATVSDVQNFSWDYPGNPGYGDGMGWS